MKLKKALKLRKAKYLKRTGSPGSYKYIYKEKVGREKAKVAVKKKPVEKLTKEQVKFKLSYLNQYTRNFDNKVTYKAGKYHFGDFSGTYSEIKKKVQGDYDKAKAKRSGKGSVTKKQVLDWIEDNLEGEYVKEWTGESVGKTSKEIYNSLIDNYGERKVNIALSRFVTGEYNNEDTDIMEVLED